MIISFISILFCDEVLVGLMLQLRKNCGIISEAAVMMNSKTVGRLCGVDCINLKNLLLLVLSVMK